MSLEFTSEKHLCNFIKKLQNKFGDNFENVLIESNTEIKIKEFKNGYQNIEG